jgi:hypothetical protein
VAGSASAAPGHLMLPSALLRSSCRGQLPVEVRVSPEMVEAWVRRTCAEQGVPERVSDPAVIGRVVALLGQVRQTGSIRAGSKRVRPRTAGRTTTRSRTAATMAR